MDPKIARILLPVINDFLFQLESRVAGNTKGYDESGFQKRWAELVKGAKENGLKREDIKRAISELQVKIEKGLKKNSNMEKNLDENLVCENLENFLNERYSDEDYDFSTEIGE